MMQAEQMSTIPFSTPLFKNCYKAQPFSQAGSTSYLMLHGQQAQPELYSQSATKFICPAFENQKSNCCFIVMEGQCFSQFVQNRQKVDPSGVILTEEEIWALLGCMAEAFVTLNAFGCSHKLTHFREYSIRRISSKKLFKLIFHESMVSQIDAAAEGHQPWSNFYLSPEQLSGQFVSEKSIVFSLGALVLNLCVPEDRARKIYHPKQFKVNEQIISSKLNMAQFTHGYSNLLCNLIKKCLIIEQANRFNFEEMKKCIYRKIQRQYMRQSQLLSQLVELQKGKNVSYDVVFPSVLPSNYSYSSPKKVSKQKDKKSPEQKKQGSNQRSVQVEQQFGKLQKSSAQNNQFQDKSNGAKVKLKKKLSSKKFQGSKASKASKDQKNEKLPKIDYRGTFGARSVLDSSSNHQNTIRKIKEPKQIISSDEQQQTEPKFKNENKKNSFIKIQDSNSHKNDSQKKIQPLKIEEFNEYNQPNSFQHRQIETPKGFGRHGQNLQYTHIPNQSLIPELITKMQVLSLDSCLQPVSSLAKSTNKIGVWVQGDLYYGDFINGRRNGLALQIFANGEYYYGHFKHDLFQGQGLYYWNEREYFFGVFELGQKVWGRLEGQIRYQGQFNDNKRHGQGTCWYHEEEIYTGNWSNGKRHGMGTLYKTHDEKFVGNWIRGKRKGQGYLLTEDMKISGTWNDEVIEGQTLIQYKNGDVFRGKTGQILEKLHGVYIFKSGTIFKGQFEDDYPKKGEVIYSNGDRYVGQLKKNLHRHGKGQYYYKNGEIYKGQWQNNTKKL